MISRRRFVHGFAGAALVLGAARWGSSKGAVLSGTQFDLTIDELPVNLGEQGRTAFRVDVSYRLAR